MKSTKALFIAALVSYPLAWYYVQNAIPGLSFFLFTLFFVIGVEFFAFFMKKERIKESIFWMIIVLLQGLASAVYHGWHAEELGDLQFLLIHLSAIYYVLARTGMLVKKETSGYLLLDVLEGIFILPFQNYFLRIRSIKNGLHTDQKYSFLSILLNVILVVFIIGIALVLLSDADTNFASLGAGIGHRLASIFQKDWWFWLLLSLPVGSYLFGLVGGSMAVESSTFHEIWEEKRKSVSSLTWQIVMSALIVIYQIFFTVSTLEYLNANGTISTMTAPSASEFAVKGFWNLICIMALNGIVLACVQYFGKNCDLMQRRFRLFSLLLLACSFAFLLLDYLKVHVYTSMYGCTPRRIYALWALAWLFAAMVLVMIRLFHKYNCVQFLLCSCASFFTALCLFNTESFVLGKVFSDLKGGKREPDLVTLEACHFGTSDHVLSYSRMLTEDDWYQGMYIYDFYDLYPESVLQQDNGENNDFCIDLKDADGTYGRLHIICKDERVIHAVIE